MAQLVTILLVGCGLALLAGLAGFAVVSLREGERRAALIAALAAPVISVPLLATSLLPTSLQQLVLAGLACLCLVGLGLWWAPVGRISHDNGTPILRFDEREIMFARSRLQPGSKRYDQYYAEHPEHRQGDDRTRQLPGLLAAGAELADPVFFAAADASFAITEALRDTVDGPVAPVRSQHAPAALTAMVKELALHYGAVSVGVAVLSPAHLYTHVGRGSGSWGEPIILDHSRGVAFTVEMDHRTMATAPAAPVVAESARQYVEAARIALQLAGLLRALGYPARAHIDGNYRVIAPLVARDAGLGEIGRIGILMTPQLGPRVRLGVVTTAAPLLPDRTGHDRSLIDFCTICKKCADCCPTGSIPRGDREPAGDGAWRWRVDADTCFRYWCAIGTDCGRCLSVCPYAHPDTAAHDLVRWAIRRSGAARRLLLRADDLFYGRRPPSRPVAGLQGSAGLEGNVRVC